MSVKKGETFKEKQRRLKAAQARRNRMLLIIGGVVVVAIIAVIILVLQNPRTQVAGEFTTVPTKTWPEPNGVSMGPASAKVVVQEFADFQCPYCRQFHDSIFQQLIDKYVTTGKVRFEYHHFIVIDANVGGKESRRAAEASECASEQGQFWNYFNMLFANQQTEGSGTFSDTRLKAFAASLGLDTAKFNSCFNSGKYANAVTQDELQANSLKLGGTPSLLVNGTLVQNPLNWDAVQAAIDAALKQAGQ